VAVRCLPMQSPLISEETEMQRHLLLLSPLRLDGWRVQFGNTVMVTIVTNGFISREMSAAKLLLDVYRQQLQVINDWI